jgi:hypothetical protein
MAESWFIGDSSETKNTLTFSARSTRSHGGTSMIVRGPADSIFLRSTGEGYRVMTTGTLEGTLDRNQGSMWSRCSCEITITVGSKSDGDIRCELSGNWNQDA